MARAFDAAADEIGLPVAPQRAAAWGWRVLVLGGPADLTARLAAALGEAGFTVTTAPFDLDPETVPASERPDLAVFGPPPGGDAAPVVERWTSAPLGRRVGMALIQNPASIDVFALPWARLDLIVDGGGAIEEITRWARVEARVAATPAMALIIAARDEDRAMMAGWLEAAGIRSTGAPDLLEAGRALDRQQPDLIVADWRMPDEDTAGFIRRIGRSPKLAIVPVLAICREPSGEDRMRALEAGAEDLLVWPVGRAVFLAAAAPRAARARRLNEVVRRDPLTGFLTPGALLDEMESVLAYARRIGERLSFVLLDIDHLRRVNEELGHPKGDQVLLHVAGVLRERVRASDVLARMGGEEFGLLLRRCGMADAVSVAENIQASLAGRPGAGETPFPIRVSAGVATYPDQAIGVRELLMVSERALREAKEGGRNRVVPGS